MRSRPGGLTEEEKRLYGEDGEDERPNGRQKAVLFAPGCGDYLYVSLKSLIGECGGDYTTRAREYYMNNQFS